MLDKLDELLENLNTKPLERVGIDGGDCNTHVLMFGGGYSQFPIEDFLAHLAKITWRDPNNVVVLTQKIGEPARIWRPAEVYR